MAQLACARNGHFSTVRTVGPDAPVGDVTWSTHTRVCVLEALPDLGAARTVAVVLLLHRERARGRPLLAVGTRRALTTRVLITVLVLDTAQPWYHLYIMPARSRGRKIIPLHARVAAYRANAHRGPRETARITPRHGAIAGLELAHVARVAALAGHPQHALEHRARLALGRGH